jgi:hypothetical protein
MVPGLAAVATVSVGTLVSCALRPGIGLFCWGDAADTGRLGTPGAPSATAVPLLVAGTEQAWGMSIGRDLIVVALERDGSLIYWGIAGGPADAVVPTDLSVGFPLGEAVATGKFSTCVLDSKVEPWCLDLFSCGEETCPNTPVKVEIPQD